MRRETTKGWEVYTQCKYESSTWNQVREVKESFPVQLEEYVVINQIADKPAFVWWKKKVLKKRDRIISKTASKHCFVDANHAGDKTTRISMTGILIFCNRAPIIWNSKRQDGVETLTFGSYFTAMKNSVELILAPY